MIKSKFMDQPEQDTPLETLEREIESWRSNMKIRKQVYAQAAERLRARLRAHKDSIK
ncbi:MAG TPA: hypothetical protein PKD58_06425 [Candidatus Sumerlaeota bacterium]|nr:hypothetical protein [Candidatus Sumerlaeota bacterium]HMZ50799.1 hypothetical protein [Candidatus Sumerlaeota bacterium]HNM45842.1 hypothetical protein [Candidatus Sumerlaeota bacterium]